MRVLLNRKNKGVSGAAGEAAAGAHLLVVVDEVAVRHERQGLAVAAPALRRGHHLRAAAPAPVAPAAAPGAGYHSSAQDLVFRFKPYGPHHAVRTPARTAPGLHAAAAPRSPLHASEGRRE